MKKNNYKHIIATAIALIAFQNMYANYAPIIQPGAPGENSKILDPSIASNIAGASYVQADVDFLKGMIIHHKQAIVMSRLADKRTNNQTIIDLANRIDVSQEDEINFSADNEDFNGVQKAAYRAQQDANTALRYIASQKEKLKIDPSWIFIGGSSAGAITSLSTSYASQEEWNLMVPQFESEMGPLESTNNSLNKIFTIRGIYNFMGAIPPVVFSSGDLIPTISFHGDLDTRVPIGKNVMTGFGSRPIHEILTEAGICNDLTIVPNGGHNIYWSKRDVDFRINRVACFFKSLICNTCVDFIAEESIPATCAN